DDVPQRVLKGSRRNCAAQKDDQIIRGYLRVRQISLWKLRYPFVESVDLQTRYDANDRVPSSTICLSRHHSNSLPHWILTGKEPLSRGLVDDHYGRRTAGIVLVEFATA